LKSLTLIILLFFLSACHMTGNMSTRYSGINSLRLNPKNTIPTKIAKVFVRVPLEIISLNCSEYRFKIDRDMESWIGRTKDELLMNYGTCASTIPTDDGGLLINFCFQKTSTVPGVSATSWSNNAVASVYSPPSENQLIFRRTFRLDSKNIIRDYSWDYYTGM